MVELCALSCLACQVRHAQSTYTRHHDDETVRLAAESLLERISQVRSRREIRNALHADRACRQPLAGFADCLALTLGTCADRPHLQHMTDVTDPRT